MTLEDQREAALASGVRKRSHLNRKRRAPHPQKTVFENPKDAAGMKDTERSRKDWPTRHSLCRAVFRVKQPEQVIKIEKVERNRPAAKCLR